MAQITFTVKELLGDTDEDNVLLECPADTAGAVVGTPLEADTIVAVTGDTDLLALGLPGGGLDFDVLQFSTDSSTIYIQVPKDILGVDLSVSGTSITGTVHLYDSGGSSWVSIDIPHYVP